jgi:toxin ParE1/3/4
MRSVRLTASARRDLDEIAAHIDEQAGSRIAETVVLRIRASIAKLSKDALRYRPRPDLGEGRRAIRVGPYIVAYRTTENCVFVLRIVHSARDKLKELIDER